MAGRETTENVLNISVCVLDTMCERIKTLKYLAGITMPPNISKRNHSYLTILLVTLWSWV